MLSCCFCTDLGFHLGWSPLLKKRELRFFFFFFLKCIFNYLGKTDSLERETVIISRKKEVMEEQVQTHPTGKWLSISLYFFSEKKMPKVTRRSATDSPLPLCFG